MGRSNTANGGNTFVDLVIQVNSISATQVSIRAVAYLTSLNVSDTSNDMSIGGGVFSRSGALNLGGVYNNAPVWFQDVTVNRALGSNYNVTVNMSWSGVNYWGVTLSASETYTVPAYYTAPSAPPTDHDSVTPTSVRVIVYPSTDGGGGGINKYEAYLLSNNAWPGAGGNVVGSSGIGTFTATGLNPGTRYYYTARAKNTAEIWSGWQTMKVVDTLPAAYVKVAGTWRNAIVYVKVAGVWKMATPYVKVAGVWKLA